MDKANISKLSPFSALKFSSPPRNLTVKPRRRRIESPPAPSSGPMTRSRTSVQTRNSTKVEGDNMNLLKEAPKEITQKKYNQRDSKAVSGATRSSSVRNDQPSTSKAPVRDSVKDTFRFVLTESPKCDSKPVKRETRNDSSQEKRPSYHNDSWQITRGRNTIPKRGLPTKYNLEMFNPAVPPPNLLKPTSVFNIPPPVSNYSFNIQPTVKEDLKKEESQSLELPKPLPASVFKFELPSVFPQTSRSESTGLAGLEEKRQKSQKQVNELLKTFGYTENGKEGKKSTIDSVMDVDEEPKMTIDLAEAILGQVLRKLFEMSRRRRFMEKNVDLIPDYEWEMKSQQYDIDRKEILEMLEPLLTATAIETLQERLKKRRAKMSWAHERNKVYRSRKQMEKERRVRTKAFVNYWHEKWQALEREKRDKEEEKKLAQRLLPDVNKRIAETKEIVQIFGRLKQLSVARLVADDQNVEGHIEDFSKKMDELQAVWDDLLMEYQEEKITLETLIDRRTSHAPLPPEPQSIEHQWLEMLFSRESLYDDQNPYLIAERDLMNLVRIRSAWDECLVPKDAAPGVGSSIPIFWVLPSTTPTAAWKKYRQQN